MISAMLLSRFRTIEEYGTYSEILLTVSLATTIFCMGLPNTITYFYPRYTTKNEKNKFLNQYNTLTLLMTIVAGCVLLFLVPAIILYFKNDHIGSLKFALLVLPMTTVFINTRGNLLVSSNQSKKLLFHSIANSICLLLIILLTQLLNKDFMFYMKLYIIVEIVFFLLVEIEFYKLAGFKPTIDFEIIRKMLMYAIPIGLATAVGTVNKEFDKLIIGRLLDTESLAQYTNAAKEMPFAFIAASFTAVLLPRISQLMKEKRSVESIEIWKKTVDINFYIISLAVFPCILFSSQIISFLYSEKYLPGITVFRVYLLVVLWRCTYFGMILNCTGRTKMILQCSVASTIVNIVLNFVFFNIFGFNGPAYSTLISVMVVDVYQLIKSAKIVNIPFRFIFPWANLIKTIVFNLIIISLIALIFEFIIGVSVSDISLIQAIILSLFCVGIHLLIQGKRIYLLWKGMK